MCNILDLNCWTFEAQNFSIINIREENIKKQTSFKWFFFVFVSFDAFFPLTRKALGKINDT